MLTVSEVHVRLLSQGLVLLAVFIIVNCCLILTADLLLIANETGLNITDIQEALLNVTSITDLLRPGELHENHQQNICVKVLFIMSLILFSTFL